MVYSLKISLLSSVTRALALSATLTWTTVALGDKAETQPATQPAADPALGDVELADYCTVLLAPKLRTHLGLNAAQREQCADLNTTLRSRMDACADDTVPHIGPMSRGITPGIISARARLQLASIGREVHDLLTPTQDKRLSDMFDKGVLQPIEVNASVDRSVPRFGPNAGKVYQTTGVQLNYTHFGESKDQPEDASAKPLPEPTTLPSRAGRDGPSTERPMPRHVRPTHRPDSAGGIGPNRNPDEFQPNIKEAASGDQFTVIKSVHVNGKGPIRRVVSSADGKYLISSEDQFVRLWDTGEGNPADVEDMDSQTMHLNATRGIAISPDGKFLAIGGDDKSVRLYGVSPEGFKQLDQEIEHDAPLWNVVFSPDGKFLFSSADDMTVIQWLLKDGRLTQKSLIKITGAMFGVKWLGVQPNLTVTCSCGDGNVRVVDFSAEHPVLKTSYRMKSEWFELPMAINPKDLTLSFASGSNLLMRGATTATARGFSTGTQRIRCIAWSPDGKFFATGSEDGHLTVWDAGGAMRYTYDRPSKFNDVTFVPNHVSAGELLVAAANENGSIYLLRLGTMHAK